VKDTKAPVLTGVPADATVECDYVPNPPNVTAKDNCDQGNIEVWYMETRENGSCKYNYKLIRSWTAQDACGNKNTKTQTITVRDTKAPVLYGVPNDKTVDCDEIPGKPQVYAKDNCDEDDIEVWYAENRVEGSCKHNYKLVRTWTAQDACGNTTTAKQTITVIDNKAPTLHGVPDDISVECDEIPSPPHVYAKDNCDNDDIEVWYMENRTDGSCKNNYKLVRSWTAQDACGNKTTKYQTIHVKDTKAPVLEGAPDDITVECGEMPQPPHVKAKDNCDTDLEVWYTEDRTDSPSSNYYKVKRTWIAQDNCGNQVKKVQFITMKRTQPPVLSGVPANMTVECDNVPARPNVNGYSNCGDDVNIHFSETREDGNCTQNYRLKRVWTATDAFGNSATATQYIQVQDTKPPVGSCPDFLDKEVRTIADLPYPNASDEIVWNMIVEIEDDFKDNCGKVIVELDRWEDIQCANPDGNHMMKTFRIFYFRVSDECGNKVPELCKVTYSAKCNNFCTHDQNFWGNKYAKANGLTSEEISETLFNKYGSIKIGQDNCGFSVNDAQCLLGLLPYNGSSNAPLPENYVLDCNIKMSNKLIAEFLALHQNIRYNFHYRDLDLDKIVLYHSCAISYPLIQDLKLSHTSTVKDLIDIANKYLACKCGGWCDDFPSDYGAKMLKAISALNEYWNECVITKPCENEIGLKKDLENSTRSKVISHSGTILNVYPNPANGGFYINLNNFMGKNAELRIYNATGRLVLNKKINNISGSDERIQLNNHPVGFYMISLKVEGEDGFKQAKVILN
jgi:hypothetical protein